MTNEFDKGYFNSLDPLVDHTIRKFTEAFKEATKFKLKDQNYNHMLILTAICELVLMFEDELRSHNVNVKYESIIEDLINYKKSVYQDGDASIYNPHVAIKF